MVNIYKLDFTILQQEILRFLIIKAGRSFNARAIANNLNVSQPAVAKSLILLKKKGLIKMEKDSESGRFSIELNRDNTDIVNFKRIINLQLIYETGFVKFINQIFPEATIILFGSYSFGEDTINSDIDIAIIGAKEKEIDIEDFEKKLERKIFLHFYSNLKDINKNLRENILNGILLKGGIQL